MEKKTLEQSAKKRKVSDIYDRDAIDRVYKFKILLPNGTSIELKLFDPDPKMPFKDFISLVKEEYFQVQRYSESMKQKRSINWKDGRLFLEDANDQKIRNIVNFLNFKPNKLHFLRLHDGSEFAETFENLWDLTPDTELLKELPEEYTFETALADLIDNSLQAVWSNRGNLRLICVDVDDERISIFDTGPGMDDSEENSIVKWGKMGASLHRTSKELGIGIRPPYIMPFFGMFGYGGPIASMHLGRHALVSSKTKESKKVYTLHLEREALLKSSCSELTWKTGGGIRDISDDEIEKTPHGSFTLVEIFEPKVKSLNVAQLQCKLKDIYFPYIQFDEGSKTGKTMTPVEFQVNGIDLAEIDGGEVAITNLHSCNGPDFVLHLHFSFKEENATKSSDKTGSRAFQQANARLKCVYFPVSKGKENIERILENLVDKGCQLSENFETFSRVSIRRLGRLLPDARWACLPFMESKFKKGDRSQLLKRCGLRVKCFIDTDAGFSPTPSKTDLAHHYPFTTALKNFGNKSIGKEEISIKVHRDGKLLSLLQLEREYQDWILQMHDQYDEEADHGEDIPTFILSPSKNRVIGFASDVLRVHRIIKRKGVTWKRDQKIKIIKGACAGVHKNNIYATLEYFLLEGFQGDVGGDARIICRPLSVPDENGCLLSEDDGEFRLDIRGSLSIPINVIDSGKCLAVSSNEWECQLERLRQKLPSTIELLSANECQELEVDGALPMECHAGEVPPKNIVAVIRPASFGSSSNCRKVEQKCITKSNSVMSIEVNFRDAQDNENVHHVYSLCVSPSSHKEIQGLFIFPLGCKYSDLFQKAGVCTFSFSISESSVKAYNRKVIIKPSSKVGKWKLFFDKQSSHNRIHKLRVGSIVQPLSIACYDVYDNRMPFPSNLEVMAKLETEKGVLFQDKDLKTYRSSKQTLRVKDLLIETGELDMIRPTYEANLVIFTPDEPFSAVIPCKVLPGRLQCVKSHPSDFGNQLIPGRIIRELKLEMFDAYGNHVRMGSEVQLNLEGFSIEDHFGSKRQVDNNGCVDLGGLLKVTAGYGQYVSFSVLVDNSVVFEQHSQTEKREMRIASKVPESVVNGTQLENVVFEIVNTEGVVDDTFHDDAEKCQSHLLQLRNESSTIDESIRYTFKRGRCTVPSIPISQKDGTFSFVACHSQHQGLRQFVEVHVMPSPKLEFYESQPLSSSRKLLLQDLSSSPQQVNYGEIQVMCSNGNVPQDSPSLLQLVNLKGLQDDILNFGEKIGALEMKLAELNELKTKIEDCLPKLQASVELFFLSNIQNVSSAKEELIRQIEGMDHSAAAVFSILYREALHLQSHNHFMNDIVGLVALLGTVDSIEQSRVLSEYLGVDQMLAIVTRSFSVVNEIQMHEPNTEVDNRHALYAKAAALGKSIDGMFLIISLEDIRPYSGEIEVGDPQRKLILPNPALPNGGTPPGFIGYAVNMINIDMNDIPMRSSFGHGLRETLFYRLFGELQVYETRKEMLAARACIKHGAVSLDGGILKENGIISLGFRCPEVCFAMEPARTDLLFSQEGKQVDEEIEANQSALREINNNIMKLTHSLYRSKKKFRRKKEKYALQLMRLSQSNEEGLDSPKLI